MTTASPLTVDRILKVGSTVYLYARSGVRGRERKLECELIGWAGGRFLLLTQPMEEGKTAQLPLNEPVTLRYVLEGEVFGLRTRVMRIQFQPVPLLFLSFPTEIENVPLRTEQRVAVRLPTVISWTPSAHPPKGTHFGFLRDVTQDGGLLEVSLEQAKTLKGRSLHVTFALGLDNEVAVNAQVKNVAHSGERYRLGIVFNWNSPDDQERVRVFCRLH